MDKKDHELLKRLRAAFQQEAEERLRSMSARLIELEKSPPPEKYLEIAETVFREAHSLKGAARSAGIGEIEKVFNELESVFAALKRRRIELTPENFDFLHQALDTIGRAIFLSEEEMAAETRNRISESARQLAKLAEERPASEQAAPAPPPHEQKPPVGHPGPGPQIAADRSSLPDTVRISVDKLDRLMRESEEMFELKLIASRTGEDYRELISMVEQIQKEWSGITPETRALRRAVDEHDEQVFLIKAGRRFLPHLSDTLEETRNHMKLLEGMLQTRLKSSEQARRGVGLMVDTLVQDMKQALMLPFSSFLEAVPKLVRDLSRDQGKEVQLVMEGSEVEIDRHILEQMQDPLIHILRNSVDHGIERPEARTALNKPRTGLIKVSIKQINGNKVEIAVTDDGAGVDLARVKKVSVNRGLLTKDQARAIDDEAAMALIFESEISTSPIVTDLSGRGLGMTIVRERVEKLGGKIFVQSRTGQGTEFRIIIPITVATFRGLLTRVGEQQFIVPTVNVEQAVRFLPEEIKTVENRQTISLNGRTFAFVQLSDILDLPRPENGRGNGKPVTAVLVSAGGKQLACGVDEVINEEEVLQKPLGPQLLRVRNISGAAALGSGRVVAILNVADLIQSATVAPFHAVRVEKGDATAKKINILVAEDSITSRMLLKNILESAGYAVKTATDGLDALTELKQGNYDLLVSDVDMPRMNGFVLTENIRENKKLAELPVVLVTALHSREDRERGIDVGANAYIVKSSFDQSNLLAVIKKLL